MVTLFNELLNEVGISPDHVTLLRHSSKKAGASHKSLHDLWLSDPKLLELYQSTQTADQPIFRSAKYWASFVCPTPNTTLFVGLYKVAHIDKRRVEWLCPHDGLPPGQGEPVDVFTTTLRPELADLIGFLQIEWDLRSVRSWARYAAKAPFPIIGEKPILNLDFPLVKQDLINALIGFGFIQQHTTKKVTQLQRKNLTIYVKNDTENFPLILHPRYLDLSSKIITFPGIDAPHPVRPYLNSNLTTFPSYKANDRDTASHFGMAVGISRAGLPAFLDLLDSTSIVDTAEGPARLFGTGDEPLTQREILAAARVGQGHFRDSLIALWKGECPVTNVNHLELLRASHIKPWNVSSNRERLDAFNGLLLCSHIDALFDSGLISFKDDRSLIISKRIDEANLKRLGVHQDFFLRGINSRHIPYLAYHRAHVFSE